MRRKLIINAKIYAENQVIDNGYIFIEDYLIKDIGFMDKLSVFEDVSIFDVKGRSVIPGFFDLQVNGAGGYLVTDNNGVDIPKIQKALAKYGTTSFLVATSPCADEDHISLINYVASLINKKGNFANVLGVHMEGPFLNPKKSGANNPNFVSLPDVEKFKIFVEAGPLKLMTISPEIGDFTDIVNFSKKNGIVLSIGHSMATYEEAMKIYELGVSSATHLFNTMNGIMARDPGIIGATVEKGCYASIITDGNHVHPFNIQLMYKMLGADRLIIITDSAPTAGTLQKEWDFDGMKIYVKGFTCYNENGNIMGSSLTMNKAASIAKKFMHCSMIELVKMCSENPARLIGCFDKKGSINIGKDADLVVLEDEIDFDINKVFVLGNEIE